MRTVGGKQIPSMDNVVNNDHLKDVEVIELLKPWEVELLIGADLAATLIPEEF